MDQIISFFILSYFILSPIYAFALTVFLVKRSLRVGLPVLATWVLVLLINIIAFFPIQVGTEGFAWIMPWFYILLYGSVGMAFSTTFTAIAVAYIAFITTVIVFFYGRRKKKY